MTKNEPWFKPRDEDGDDRMLDEKFGRGGDGYRGGRSCTLVLLAGAGGLAALAAATVEGVSRIA